MCGVCLYNYCDMFMQYDSTINFLYMEATNVCNFFTCAI